MENNQSKAHATGRIGVIDAIRGFAILGILFANIQSWSGYKFIPYDTLITLPYYYLDGLFSTLQLWVIDGKFYAIFSILFGVGFGIQYNKNETNDGPFVRGYRRRLAFLLLFGLLHMLLWSGDILTLYALLAFVLVMLRKTPTPYLLPLSMGLLCWFLISQFLHLQFAGPPETWTKLAHKHYPDMDPQKIVNAFAYGDWWDVFTTNLHNIYWRWLDFIPNGRVSRVLGLFVLGFYFARSGYFINQAHRFRWIVIYGVIGLLLTYGAIITNANISYWATDISSLLAKALLVAAQVILALCYMSILAFLYQSKLLNQFLWPLALIGRTAFTNYLLHTVVGMSIFYGVGFGLFGSLGLAQLWLLALVIYSVQVLLSSLWLRYFRQGPVEWLWRCLASNKWTPNRKSKSLK
ncbi:DUF418 domain-containing protein [Deltaproteobacteria bacterium]|nr:DUF418 domain-containing protein [Deltaproteobacteria bacterium]